MKDIFVSSTFKDFQYERDILCNEVMPELNKAARDYGEYVSFCDLRWGIDTTDEYENSANKILSSCLDEIDRSRPYMIVLLGERYGYVPGTDIIENEVKKRNLAINDLEISVTQLEIEYGALKDKQSLEHTFFYFRENTVETDILQSEVHSEIEKYYAKLQELKKRILDLAKDKVRFYKSNLTSSKDFVDMVSADLLSDLTAEWKKLDALSIYEKDNCAQWNFIDEKAKYFGVHKEFADDVLTRLHKTDADNLVVITGESGSGKSTCFSYICKVLRNEGWDVISFLGGATQISTDETGILQSIVWQMETLLGVSHFEQEEKEPTEISSIIGYRKRLNDLCLAYEKTGRHILLGADALDQVFGNREINSFPFIPAHRSQNISILLTTLNGMALPSEAVEMKLTGLSEQDKRTVINNVLYAKGKQLSDVVITEVLKKKASDNPLYLYLVIHRLCLMGEQDYSYINSCKDQMHAINDFQIQLIKRMSDDHEILAAELLQHMITVFEAEDLTVCLEFIALSRFGLRTEDLRHLLQNQGRRFVPYQFARLVNYLGEIFILRNDGRYDFMHNTFRNGILVNLHNSADELAEYFLSLPWEDPLRIQELTYYLIKAKRYHDLSEYIYDLDKDTKEALYAEEDIYMVCKENPAWLLSVLNEISQKKEDIPFVCSLASFFILHVSDRFCTDLEGTEKSLVQLIELTELFEQWLAHPDVHFLDKDDFMNAKYVCVWAFMACGRIFRNKLTKDNLKTAEKYYNKAYQLCHHAILESQNDFSVTELAMVFMEIGDLAKSAGGEENSSYALDLYLQALPMAEAVLEVNASEGHKRNVVVLCERIGGVYFRKGKDEFVDKGLEYVNKGCEIMETLTTENPSIRNKYELANILSHLAEGYTFKPQNSDLDIAINLYQRVLEIRYHIYMEYYSSESIDALLESYMALGFVFDKRKSQEDLQKAVYYYLKGYKLAENNYNDRKLPENAADLIRVSKELCRVLIAIGGAENQSDALYYGSQSYQLAYKRAESIRDYHSIMLLTDAAKNLAIVYCGLDGKDNLKHGLDILNKCRGLLEYMLEHEMAADLNVKRVYTDLLDYIGILYEKIGDLDSRLKALAAYKSSLEISETIVKTDGTSADRQRNIEIGAHKIGNLLLYLSGTKTVEAAIGYLQKALGIAISLNEQYPSDQFMWDLSLSYVLNGRAFICTERRDMIIKARDYFESALEIRKKLDEQKSTSDSKRSLMICYNYVASAYRLLGGRNELVKAKDAVVKAAQLAESIMTADGTTESIFDAADTYKDLGDCLLAVNDSIGSYQAYQKSLKLCQMLASQMQTHRIYELYIQVCLHMGNMYLHRQQNDKAIEYFEMCITITRECCAFETYDDSKIMLVDVYMKLEKYYDKIGTRYAKEKVIQMYEDSIKIYENLQHLKESYIQENLASLYFGAGEAYRMVRGENKAIEYYKKHINLTDIIASRSRALEKNIYAYTSYSRIGGILAYRNTAGSIKEALYFFQKSIESAMELLGQIDNSRLSELISDIHNDYLYAANLCIAIHDKEWMTRFRLLGEAFKMKLVKRTNSAGNFQRTPSVVS